MTSESSIKPDSLAEDVRVTKSMLILDCRPQTDFARSHIKGAISVFLPSLMLRRLKAGKLNLSCIIQNNEAKDKFNRSWKTHPVVLYDDSKSEPTATSVVGLLAKKFKQEGASPLMLTGGFRNFEENFPEFCEGQEDKTVEKDILGLSSLKISEDSAYGTCDSENGDLDSPTSNVPVKVIPYLYLGNAKNSADLSVLKDHGITYILNVTPNVPNKFENDSTFKYMKIPISDHLSQNLSQFFPEAIAFIDEARDSEQGVLVHCLAGISRSVTITVAYLMQKRDLSLNEAYDYVKTCKPNISPNFNFMGQLLDFQRSLGRSLTCSCEGECTQLCCGADHPLLSDHSDHSQCPSPSPSPSSPT